MEVPKKWKNCQMLWCGRILECLIPYICKQGLAHRAYIVKKTCDFVTSCRTPPGGGGVPADLSSLRGFGGFLSSLSEKVVFKIFRSFLSAKMKRKRRGN